MKKESKANLIFITLLVLSVIPGIVLLVRKKLNGEGASPALPDPVPYVVAYNQPAPFPPGLPRKEPLLARDWVQHTVQEKVGIDVSMTRNGPDAVVSDAYFTQVVAYSAESAPAGTQGGYLRVWLLIWRQQPPVTASDPVVSPASKNAPAEVISIEQLQVPKDVRHALQGVGYIDPPEKIWLGCYRLHYDDVAGEGALQTLKITHSTGKPLVENITLP